MRSEPDGGRLVIGIQHHDRESWICPTAEDDSEALHYNFPRANFVAPEDIRLYDRRRTTLSVGRSCWSEVELANFQAALARSVGVILLPRRRKQDGHFSNDRKVRQFETPSPHFGSSAIDRKIQKGSVHRDQSFRYLYDRAIEPTLIPGEGFLSASPRPSNIASVLRTLQCLWFVF